MKIGIPRALIHWKYPVFWEDFFKNLGVEVLVSPKTNKEIVQIGSRISDPETCFSVKVFFGHLLWLEGKVDFIFIPRLKANKQKFEYCPKLFALPDLANILTKTPILTANFDCRREKFEKTLEGLGGKINKSKDEVKEAARKAFLKEIEYEAKNQEEFLEKIKSEKKKKIILISHPYNLYDDYVNLKVEDRLKKLGVEPFFIDRAPSPRRSSAGSGTDDGLPIRDYPDFHWEFGREIMEKTEEVLNYGFSGAIEISSFQCGCDAVLKEFVERKIKRKKVPFLYLIIDEQTGEAGFQTRLEAFVDTLK